MPWYCPFSLQYLAAFAAQSLFASIESTHLHRLRSQAVDSPAPNSSHILSFKSHVLITSIQGHIHQGSTSPLSGSNRCHSTRPSSFIIVLCIRYGNRLAI